jgi:hypothetical protein
VNISRVARVFGAAVIAIVALATGLASLHHPIVGCCLVPRIDATFRP